MEALLQCSNAECTQIIKVGYQETDQLIICPKCGKKFLFVNLGVYKCSYCTKPINVPLFIEMETIVCESCNKRQPLKKAGGSVVYKPFISNDLTGVGRCMANAWEGFEQQANNAKLAYKQIERKYSAPTAVYKKRALFVEVLDMERAVFPIRYLRVLHATCSFKMNPSFETPKYLGTVLGFEDTNVIGQLVKSWEVTDIWVLNEKTANLLKKLPTFLPYANRIKII